MDGHRLRVTRLYRYRRKISKDRARFVVNSDGEGRSPGWKSGCRRRGYVRVDWRMPVARSAIAFLFSPAERIEWIIATARSAVANVYVACSALPIRE